MIRPHDQKSVAVRNYLVGAIRSGRIGKGDKVPSELALSTRFKINKATCNKAVSMLVSEGYLERRLGAGTFVRGDSSPNAPLIGVVITLRPGSFFPQMLSGIQEEAARRGYGLLFFQSPPAGSDMAEFRKYIASTGAKGVIINTPFFSPVPGMHNVYMNTAVPNHKVNQVQNDDFNGGYLLGKHFAENGHEHVAFVSRDTARGDLLSRVRGFQQAVGDGKLRGAYAKLQSYARAEGNLFHVLRTLLTSDHRLSAIGFDTIHVANEAYRILKELKRRMPDDVSIAGFGNLQGNEQTIKLTTIDQHPLALGQAAAEALIGLIEGRMRDGIDITIPVKLLRGDSVSCLRRPEPCGVARTS